MHVGVCVHLCEWPQSVHHTVSPALLTLYPWEWEVAGFWCGWQSPPLSLWLQISGQGPRGLARLRWPQRQWSAVRFSSVTWPWSRDSVGAANSAAALASSCGGKTFQQLASDSSRNICNVRQWWESPPCSFRTQPYDNRVGGLRIILKGHAFSLICTAVVSHDTKVVGEQVFRAPLSYQCDTHTHTHRALLWRGAGVISYLQADLSVCAGERSIAFDISLIWRMFEVWCNISCSHLALSRFPLKSPPYLLKLPERQHKYHTVRPLWGRKML